MSEYWLQLIGAAISLVWVYLEYKASMWLWPIGIVLPIFYMAISWEARFIGNIAINAYYLVASVVGWVVWLRGHSGAQKPIERAPRSAYAWAPLALVCGVAIYLLVSLGSALPWADAVSTTASVVGMIFLGRKWLEHWVCWMVANTTGALLWYVSGDYISAVVFVINLGVSVAGYVHWCKMYLAQEKNQER